MLTLGMPKRACWLLTTSGPNWNSAPPPVMVNWMVFVWPAATEAVMFEGRGIDRQRVAVAVGRRRR